MTNLEAENAALREALTWIEQRCRVHNDSAGDVVNDVLAMAARATANPSPIADAIGEVVKAALAFQNARIATRSVPGWASCTPEERAVWNTETERLGALFDALAKWRAARGERDG